MPKYASYNVIKKLYDKVKSKDAFIVRGGEITLVNGEGRTANYDASEMVGSYVPIAIGVEYTVAGHFDYGSSDTANFMVRFVDDNKFFLKVTNNDTAGPSKTVRFRIVFMKIYD